MNVAHIYMLIAGGAVTSMAHAMLRRNGPSTLAMAALFILAGSRGGLPVDMLSVATAIFLVALVVAPVAIWFGHPQKNGFLVGLTGTAIAIVSSLLPSSPSIGIPAWNDIVKAGAQIQSYARI